MVNLTIDGIPVEVSADTTVLQAARKLRINIPTLCYYEAIEAYGGCRLCVVEVEKNGRSRLTAVLYLAGGRRAGSSRRSLPGSSRRDR